MEWTYYSGEKPPAFNILQPIVDHKISTVAQNGMTINYSTMNYGNDYLKSISLCGKLNDHAQMEWERLKMDRELWNVVKEACISGDSFRYFFYNKDKKTNA